MEAHRVFVYGSLLADDVVRLLLKRLPYSSPALLPCFHRFSIKGRVYPAILPAPNKHVTGRVLSGISGSELQILDAFEDVEYQRTIVHVSLLDGDGSQKLEAHTYVWQDSNDPDLFGEWDFEEWKRAHMDDFVKMTNGFVEELHQPQSKPRIATYESFFHHHRDGEHPRMSS